ncbi:hypothetical protein NMY22_g7545 [Coprinellus aureogranulatus]|nr:hypothetical protein NMY22_g7545 [Coprinellus aureogranulatus]
MDIKERLPISLLLEIAPSRGDVELRPQPAFCNSSRSPIPEVNVHGDASPTAAPEGPSSPETPAAASEGPSSPETPGRLPLPPFLANRTIQARVYASDANPIHGRITVYRGNKKYKIARLHKMKHLYQKRKDATKAFDRLSRDAVTRVEAAAERTGGWVYLAMLHPGSRQPFLEYASRRLRKDATEEVEQVHKAVSTMMHLVKQADRAADIDVQRVQQQAEEQVRKAQDEADAAKAAADAALEENARLRKALAVRDQILSLSASVLETQITSASA